MPLSSSPMINREEIIELLEEAAHRMPDELRQARWMLKERQDFIDKTKREAEDILDAARAQAERMVQRTEVVRAAELRARKMVEAAENEARRMKLEIEDFCDQRLASFEIVLERTLKTVGTGREKLNGRINDTRPAGAARAGDHLRLLRPGRTIAPTRSCSTWGSCCGGRRAASSTGDGAGRGRHAGGDASVADGTPVDGGRELESLSDGITVNGVVADHVAGTCRRCLGPASGPLVAEVQELYQVRPISEEAFAFDGEQLDLRPMVRELVLHGAAARAAVPRGLRRHLPRCAERPQRGGCGLRARRWAIPVGRPRRTCGTLEAENSTRVAAGRGARARADRLSRLGREDRRRWPSQEEEVEVEDPQPPARPWRLAAPARNVCPRCGRAKLPHVVCPSAAGTRTASASTSDVTSTSLDAAHRGRRHGRRPRARRGRGRGPPRRRGEGHPRRARRPPRRARRRGGHRGAGGLRGDRHGRRPGRAVRRKKDSSLVRAAETVRDGVASAMVSAGNTGAAMAASLLRMGRIRGVAGPRSPSSSRRPGGPPTVMLDAGANAECQPEWLVQFGQMGAVYSRLRFGVERPRVGLMSIGEESVKGNELVKEAHPLIAAGGHGRASSSATSRGGT